MLETYYVALPVTTRDDGGLVADYSQAVRCESAEQAVQVAAFIARQRPYKAAVAFGRRGDPATGRYDECEILARKGDLTWYPRRRGWIT
jgi:hypothetical protein